MVLIKHPANTPLLFTVTPEWWWQSNGCIKMCVCMCGCVCASEQTFSHFSQAWWQTVTGNTTHFFLGGGSWKIFSFIRVGGSTLLPTTTYVGHQGQSLHVEWWIRRGEYIPLFSATDKTTGLLLEVIPGSYFGITHISLNQRAMISLSLHWKFRGTPLLLQTTPYLALLVSVMSYTPPSVIPGSTPGICRVY